MSSFTKNAIKSSFLKLLEEKPLSQITVKMIVEDCGINRNSFYYHYADIPALMEEIAHDDAEGNDRFCDNSQKIRDAYIQLGQPRYFRKVSVEGVRLCYHYIQQSRALRSRDRSF